MCAIGCELRRALTSDLSSMTLRICSKFFDTMVHRLLSLVYAVNDKAAGRSKTLDAI